MPRLRATGRLDAVVAIAGLPADAASALLPAGLELMPPNLMPAGRHPLILLAGEHSRVGTVLLPFGLRYRELVIAVPSVRPRDGPAGPFCHLPLLLLDRELPTLLGRWLYGFAKRRATIRRTAERFEAVRRSDSTPVLEARFAAIAGQPDPGPVRGLFEQPLISGGEQGRWRYARFDFGLDRASLGGARVEVVIGPALLPGLAPGPLPIDRAFRLETRWTLERLQPAPRGFSGARPSPKKARS